MLFSRKLDRIDRRVTLRISLGVVFFWFGCLKFFPGLSPAQDLAGRTIESLSHGLIQPALSLPILAAWESLIGLGLISGLFLRGTLFLLLVQMLGTVLPFFFFPQEIFVRFPYALTLEGQYIVKNLVLVAAGLVLGSTVRGGRIVPERQGA